MAEREKDIQGKVMGFQTEVQKLREFQKVEEHEKELEAKVEELEMTVDVL